MLIESFIVDSLIDSTPNPERKKSSFHWFQLWLLCALKISIMCIAAYLAWDCNTKNSMLLKIFNTTLATLFSGFYILFYAVYRVLLKNSCY